MGGFIRNFLCVFVVLCVNLVCVTVGGDADLRVPSGCDNLPSLITFPPLLTLPYHAPDYLLRSSRL